MISVAEGSHRREPSDRSKRWTNPSKRKKYMGLGREISRLITSDGSRFDASIKEGMGPAPRAAADIVVSMAERA